MKRYEHDRDGYTTSKSSFVLKYTEIAREEYVNKYNPRRLFTYN